MNKLDTEYTVQPSPKTPAPAEALAQLKATAIDLEALSRGKDPFKGPAHAEVEQSERNIADSKPNDFKDFGEQ